MLFVFELPFGSTNFPLKVCSQTTDEKSWNILLHTAVLRIWLFVLLNCLCNCSITSLSYMFSSLWLDFEADCYRQNPQLLSKRFWEGYEMLNVFNMTNYRKGNIWTSLILHLWKGWNIYKANRVTMHWILFTSLIFVVLEWYATNFTNTEVLCILF